jgi:TonB family protein
LEPGTPKILEKSIAKAREVSGDPNLAFQSVSVPFSYPEAACQDRAQGLAIVAILVKPNGEQAQEPELLGDSGSEILNDAAVATVKNHRFGATGQYQAFLPSFNFEYSEEVCSKAATPSPSTESSPNPNQSPPNSQNTPNNSQSTPQKISITSVYPKAACKERLQGSTLVAATVKPNSQQAENLKILSSSGHQTLDQAAIGAAKGSKFKSTSQEQNLALDFQFQYSEAVCPKGATQPSRPSTKSSGEATPKSSQENPSSPESSKDSKSPSPSRKSSQPASQESSGTEPASQESSGSSEEPASQESSGTEPASQESSGSSEEPTTP